MLSYPACGMIAAGLARISRVIGGGTYDSRILGSRQFIRSRAARARTLHVSQSLDCRIPTQTLHRLLGHLVLMAQRVAGVSKCRCSSRKDALDSIMNNRNQISHGGTVGISVHGVRDYLDRCVEVLEFIEDQCAGKSRY